MTMPANFEGRVPRIDPDDAVMLLIDHQSGLFNTVRDLDLRQLRANAITLAKVATLAKMPVITTASVPQGPNGPLIPEIHQVAPHAQYVARKGQINSWDNPDFVAAVKATGKKQLIIAGTITSVCMAFSRNFCNCRRLPSFLCGRRFRDLFKNGRRNHACPYCSGRCRADGYSSRLF